MKHQDTVIDLSLMKVTCQGCSLHEMCLPRGLDESGLKRLEKIVKHARPIQRGSYLYDAGDPLQCLYAVRSGSVKTYVRSRTGTEQIVGFHLPGELLGVDALEADSHPCAAVALETTSVCKVPYERLEELCQSIPSLGRQMNRLVSGEIMRDHLVLLSLRRHNAAGRLASFLLSISMRAERRGLAPREFTLSMPCVDIANYLGLTTATVSRLVRRFHDDGLLSVDRHLCRIQDMVGLQALVDECAAELAAGQSR